MAANKAFRILLKNKEQPHHIYMNSIYALIGPDMHKHFPEGNMFKLLGCDMKFCNCITDLYPNIDTRFAEIEYIKHIKGLLKKLSRMEKFNELSVCFNSCVSLNDYRSNARLYGGNSCDGNCRGKCDDCGVLRCGCIDTCRNFLHW